MKNKNTCKHDNFNCYFIIFQKSEKSTCYTKKKSSYEIPNWLHYPNKLLKNKNTQQYTQNLKPIHFWLHLEF